MRRPASAFPFGHLEWPQCPVWKGMCMASKQKTLFELPDGMRRPKAQVIILTGPSGSGKTALSRRVGLPAVQLDNFYRDDDEPHMPRLTGNFIDWDDPQSWNEDEAFAAVAQLCVEGQTQMPIYDIPTNKRTGTRTAALGTQPLFIAEGIFAGQLVPRLVDEGLMADAICIARSPLRNAWFRLLRDTAEGRKPLPHLLYRGAHLAREEPSKVRGWVSQGCRPVPSLAAAEEDIKLLLRRAQLAARSAQR